jgi:hypothetical protein
VNVVPPARTRPLDTRQAAKRHSGETVSGIIVHPARRKVRPSCHGSADARDETSDRGICHPARRRQLAGSRSSELVYLYCRDRLVLLTNRHGQLSGSVAFARASAPIHNLVLLSDGSFSGETRGGVAGSRLGRFYKVAGKFSGDAVSVTLEGTGCPPRHGTATRCVTCG